VIVPIVAMTVRRDRHADDPSTVRTPSSSPSARRTLGQPWDEHQRAIWWSVCSPFSTVSETVRAPDLQLAIFLGIPAVTCMGRWGDTVQEAYECRPSKREMILDANERLGAFRDRQP
jgi:hypothetical protein